MLWAWAVRGREQNEDIVYVLGVTQCPSGEVLSRAFSILTNLFR